MQKRRLGRTGLKVSVLGYGAGADGGLFTKDQFQKLAKRESPCLAKASSWNGPIVDNPLPLRFSLDFAFHHPP